MRRTGGRWRGSIARLASRAGAVRVNERGRDACVRLVRDGREALVAWRGLARTVAGCVLAACLVVGLPAVHREH